MLFFEAEFNKSKLGYFVGTSFSLNGIYVSKNFDLH